MLSLVACETRELRPGAGARPARHPCRRTPPPPRPAGSCPRTACGGRGSARQGPPAAAPPLGGTAYPLRSEPNASHQILFNRDLSAWAHIRVATSAVPAASSTRALSSSLPYPCHQEPCIRSSSFSRITRNVESGDESNTHMSCTCAQLSSARSHVKLSRSSLVEKQEGKHRGGGGGGSGCTEPSVAPKGGESSEGTEMAHGWLTSDRRTMWA